MGEYAQFGRDRVKIGTCETMYYLRADQRHMVTALRGNVNPVKDATSIRFRFPWPDEDNCPPGGFNGDYNRAIAVDVPMPEGVDHNTIQFSAQAGYLVSLPCPEQPGSNPGLRIHRNGFAGAVKLAQQKVLADGRIVPVLMCGGCGALWRVEDEADIRAIADAFYAEGERRRLDSWLDSGEKVGHVFWHTIADRVLEGARLASPAKVLGLTKVGAS